VRFSISAGSVREAGVSSGERTIGVVLQSCTPGTRIACALGYGRTIGTIDIELDAAGLDAVELAERVFCAREIAALKRDTTNRTRLFFK